VGVAALPPDFGSALGSACWTMPIRDESGLEAPDDMGGEPPPSAGCCDPPPSASDCVPAPNGIGDEPPPLQAGTAQRSANPTSDREKVPRDACLS
jgi:hypothetical protein